MIRFECERVIEAPPELVFRTVSDIRQFSKALPHIQDYDFLTESTYGVGTRFRETRLMNGRKAITELEVVELEENKYVRMITENHGTIWDTLFRVDISEQGTLLSITMDARSKKLFARLMNRLIKRMIQQAVERDMDLVKEYCEKTNS